MVRSPGPATSASAGHAAGHDTGHTEGYNREDAGQQRYENHKMGTRMGTYQDTHPWLSFSVDLQRMPPDFWMAMGEAKSKCDHIAQVPLRNDVALELYKLYLAKGVHATTAIEGNTLSEEQVREEIDGALKVPESQEYQRQEIVNIIEACDAIESGVFASGAHDGMLRYDDILKYNEMALKGLDLDDGVAPGQIRDHSVVVGNVYRGPPADQCADLLNRLCDWLNGPAFIDLHVRFGVGASLLRAALAHLYLAWIHPFGDGNGRTARLVEFQILVASGVPSPSAHLLSNHYNHTRPRYYSELKQASQNGGDVTAFLCYGFDGFVEGLRSQIGYILENYLQDLVWRDFIDQQLVDQSDQVAARQKELLVALFREKRPVKKASLTTLSARTAELYREKGPKTLSRDVNALSTLDLIRSTADGWAANRSLIRQFLPPISDVPTPVAP